MPLVSVLMPIYNTRESDLREAVASILSQTFEDFELIILNDSPDNKKLGQIVGSFPDGRIKYFANDKNRGISFNRNKLMELAQGEFLATMDHDDISLPQRLEKQLAYMRANPDVGLVSCWSKNIGGRRVKRHPVGDSKIKEMLMLQSCIEHSATMTRKSVLEKNGVKYKAEFSPAEDYALYCDLIEFTNFHVIPEVLFLYRRHSGNTTHAQADKMRSATIAIKAQVRRKYPLLWELAKEKYLTIFQVRLFGFIPFFKIVKRDEYRYALYLFNFILLAQLKIKANKG